MPAPEVRTVPRLSASLALSFLLLAAAPAMAQTVTSRAIASRVTPPSTGDAGCDAAAQAWRACIAASSKPASDKTEANTEVDKFIRDVFDARGPHRASITSACPRTVEGYRMMLSGGTCAANTTGAKDDQISRARSTASAAR
jgi:hypothetical protein